MLCDQASSCEVCQGNQKVSDSRYCWKTIFFYYLKFQLLLTFNIPCVSGASCGKWCWSRCRGHWSGRGKTWGTANSQARERGFNVPQTAGSASLPAAHSACFPHRAGRWMVLTLPALGLRDTEGLALVVPWRFCPGLSPPREWWLSQKRTNFQFGSRCAEEFTTF